MTQPPPLKLSNAEQDAIVWLKEAGGSILVTDVEDKNTKGFFGDVIPGMSIFRKLEKKGLVFFTEEEPTIFDDGTEFTFTSEIYLVD